MITGFANGCFDCLHEGHLYFLGECAKHCDYLIVAVNSDRSIAALKGPGRPVQSLEDRIYHLAARCPDVDAIIKFDGRTDPLIMEIRPDVVFKGYDHCGADPEAKICIRVPRWRNHHDAHVRDWDIIPIIGIDQLAGYSTSLQLANAKAKTSA